MRSPAWGSNQVSKWPLWGGGWGSNRVKKSIFLKEIDPKLSKDVKTITLSYTFFEVGGKVPAAPVAMSTQPVSATKDGA